MPTISDSLPEIEMAAAVAAAAATTILPPQTSNEQVETTSTEATDNTTTTNSSHHHQKDSCSYCEETERAILRLSPIIGEKSRVDEEENESVINVDEYLDLDADDEQQLTSSYSNLSSINPHTNHTTKRRANTNTTTLRNTNMSTNILMTRSNNKLKYYRSITDMSSCGSSGRFAATNKRYDFKRDDKNINR